MSRGWAVLLLGLVLIGLYVAMWRGWRRRASRQSDLPPLPEPLPDAQTLFGPVEGVYLGTTSAGDWLDRMAARTLGRPSPASVMVSAAGVAIDRTPEPRLDIPAAALRAVRADRVGAHRATRSEQLLVVTWTHGGRLLETVVRPRHHRDLEVLTGTIAELVRDGAAA